jgi:hypothetical protein
MSLKGASSMPGFRTSNSVILLGRFSAEENDQLC